MRIRFLFGPAGSGKTFRCLGEIRSALSDRTAREPLLLLAPKQATFQLERQLLSDPSLPGYTRLQILSFERVADFILDQISGPGPGLLEEQGRVMVLRALLARNQSRLKVFHSTARLPGFAQQLNVLLRDFQRHQLTPARLEVLSAKFQSIPTLSGKLHDTGLLMEGYLNWLRAAELRDANTALDFATGLITSGGDGNTVRIGGLWLDGFAEMTPQELELLAALLSRSARSTLAFCVDRRCCTAGEGEPNGTAASWETGWGVVSRTASRCYERAKAIGGGEVEIEWLSSDAGRFRSSPALRHFERCWAVGAGAVPAPDTGAVRFVKCADPEAEAVFAARAILGFVREGGRFREVSVLVRRLDGYHDVLRRVFSRYEIPFFLDRREPVAHHPLAELTRYSVRLAAFGWQHGDWFGALKTGLVTEDDRDVDRLENEALARGWEGDLWFEPIRISEDAALEESMNRMLRSMLPPFESWNRSMTSVQRRPTGTQLASALRELWGELGVERTLERWSERALPGSGSRIHDTVFDQMQDWLANIELAFANEALSLAEWIPILESGLANLSVGVIPPALDQVLIGAIDRSRNPELELVVLPGWNETVFPAVPSPGPLLNEAEREILASERLQIGPGKLEQLGHERYYAYIACTRARSKVLITCAARDSGGRPLNPSPFLVQARRFMDAPEETFDGDVDWRDAVSSVELAAPVLRAMADPGSEPALEQLASLTVLESAIEQWRTVREATAVKQLSAASAEKLYGPELRTSVSGLEDFAACPFKFFVSRGLRLQERKEYQFDDRDKGSFQHEVLRAFHDELASSGRRWRDLNVREAEELVVRIGRRMLPEFAGGRFLASGVARFTGEVLIERLARLVASLTAWLPQYEFDTRRVELGFGMDDAGLPAWRIALPGGRSIVLRGRIDRVDLCREGDRTFAVVMDYKSSVRSLNPTRLHHGLDLQLLSYLGVLKHVSEPGRWFGVDALTPAGVFYIPLNGGAGGSGKSRAEVLSAGETGRRLAYQHSGRFLGDALRFFDNRGGSRGDQFRYARNKDGGWKARGNEALEAADFENLRVKVEGHLREYGTKIFQGEVSVSPFRIGKDVACDRCDFRAGCRFDPWTQPYRNLRPPPRDPRRDEVRRSK